MRLHTHLAETADEDEYCLAKYGVRPVELMERCEFIGPDVFYAHGIFFNDEELATLRARGAHIAHCPSSNMRLGSGFCRVRDMLDLGIPVSLAVDGSASNDSSDFLGEMRHALLLQRVWRGSGALGARDVLRMATVAGAGALGFEGIGRVEEGYAADLAIFDVGRLEYCGSLSDPFAALLFRGLRPRHGLHDLQRQGRRGQGAGSPAWTKRSLIREANRISGASRAPERSSRGTSVPPAERAVPGALFLPSRQLDDVVAELGRDDVTEPAVGKPFARRLECRDHLAGAEPAQVAAARLSRGRSNAPGPSLRSLPRA